MHQLTSASSARKCLLTCGQKTKHWDSLDFLLTRAGEESWWQKHRKTYLSDTLTGNFLPLSLWSMSQRPTTNDSLPSLPVRCVSTSSYTSYNWSADRRLRLQISLTTTFATSLAYSAGKCIPRFDAQRPSYRFRSTSVIASFHRFLSPSVCLCGGWKRCAFFLSCSSFSPLSL